MPGHFEHLKFCAQKASSRRLFNEKVRPRRFDFQLEAEIPEKVAVRNHRLGQRMAADLAIESVLNFGDVLDVIDVAVSQ